jgi:hypothetical protein
LGEDLTSVKVSGQWLTLGLTVDDLSGLVLTVDGLAGEDAQTLREWIEPVAEAVEVQILATDDADAFKTVADELGLEQQVCKGHVKRNTQALIDSLLPEATLADVHGQEIAGRKLDDGEGEHRDDQQQGNELEHAVYDVVEHGSLLALKAVWSGPKRESGA